MSYVDARNTSLVRNAMSFHGLGALAEPDIEIDYYADESDLRWRDNSVRTMHSRLVKLDADWHRALANLPIDIIPDEGIRVAARAFMQYPMPLASEVALALEVIWGNRPFDESCVSVLVFARDRLLGAAGAMAGIASTAGIVAGVLAFVGPADLGISAASVGSFAAMSGVSSAVLTGLGLVIEALSRGEMPKKEHVDLMLSGASAATGVSKPSGNEQRAALAALASREEAEKASDRRESLIDLAKRKSTQKREACRSRGGIFDPSAPGGCRIPSSKKTEEKLKNAGVDVGTKTNMLVPAGLAAVGVIGVWLISRRKPRSNPKPKRRRRRR